jgi:hypothetical protein
VSFELTTEVTQTVVFDTDPDPTKTNTAVAISLFDGPCPAQQMLQCTRMPCPGMNYGSLAATLPGPHKFCLVVEQNDPSSSSDLVTLRMFTSGRRAAMIFDAAAGGNLMPGDTCSGDDPSAQPFSCASTSGPPASVALVPVCPGVHALMGSVMPSQPTAFSLHAGSPDAPEVPEGCFATGSPTPIDASLLHSADMLVGPQPYWLLIEHVGPSCGGFQLQLTAP